MKRFVVVLLPALLLLSGSDDPQEGAYRFNRYLGFWSLCAALAVVGGVVGLAVGYFGSRAIRTKRASRNQAAIHGGQA